MHYEKFKHIHVVLSNYLYSLVIILYTLPVIN